MNQRSPLKSSAIVVGRWRVKIWWNVPRLLYRYLRHFRSVRGAFQLSGRIYDITRDATYPGVRVFFFEIGRPDEVTLLLVGPRPALANPPEQTMSEHTMGPWRAEFVESGGYDCMTDAWHIKSPAGIICDVDLGSYGQNARFRRQKSARAESDARLIAAAPDLLQACEAALNDRMYKDWPGVADLLIAAIAKARGEKRPT